MNRLAAAIEPVVTPLRSTAVTLEMVPATGSLDILNCGAGHLRFSFDTGNTAEVDRAKSVIRDMLKRGYMLFVQKGNEQVRVRQFDPATNEYLIEETEPEVLAATEAIADTIEPRRRRGRPPTMSRQSVRDSKATAIAPTAGG
jgi:hypothetical protein